MNSGATNHFANDVRELTDLKPINAAVLLGDDLKVEITRSGQAKIRITNTKSYSFTAYFAPSFRISLLSIPLLDKAGFNTTFKDGRAKVVDSANNTIMTATLMDGLYKVDENQRDPLDTIYARAAVNSAIDQVGPLTLKNICPLQKTNCVAVPESVTNSQTDCPNPCPQIVENYHSDEAKDRKRDAITPKASIKRK